MIIPPEVLGTFFVVSILLGLAPGPDNIFVVTQSALFGRMAGFIVTLGLCTGLVFHTIAVALGVAVIFQTSAIAFNVLKIIGVGYLLYLAWQAFKAGSTKISLTENSTPSIKKLYGKGIIMSTSNPKLAIFFLAFLPQFADPEKGSMVIQLFILGGVFILSAIIVMGGFAILAGTLGTKLSKSEHAQKVMNKIAGIVFVSLALKLVLTQR